MRFFRKVVDERQELEMMRVESVGFRVLIFGLAGSIMIQLLFFNIAPRDVLSEVIVLFIGAGIIAVCSIWRGLWSKYSKPRLKSYVINSIAVGFAYGVVVVFVRIQHELSFGELAQIFVVSFLGFTVFMFVIYALLGTITKMRSKKLEQEHGEDE